MIATNVLLTIIVNAISGDLLIDVARILIGRIGRAVCVRVLRVAWVCRIHAEIKTIMPTPAIVITNRKSGSLNPDAKMRMGKCRSTDRKCKYQPDQKLLHANHLGLKK